MCIMGPTASGKSGYGLVLAKRINAEIISVDSAQVYRGLDIGTAKPSKKETEEVPHHLIDIRDPSESYSAGDFCVDATSAIEAIIARNKVPFLVGGTMLYYKALQQGLANLPVADLNLRAKIEEEAERIGWAAMHQKLVSIDPKAAAKIAPNDTQRIQRSIEVFEITGTPISEIQSEADQESPYEFTNIALIPKDRKQLRQIIQLRFDGMLNKGFVKEVEGLYKRGDLGPDLPAVRAVGYRQLWEYFEGKTDLPTACKKAVTATCQLAKRQLTWLRSWPDLIQMGT